MSYIWLRAFRLSRCSPGVNHLRIRHRSCSLFSSSLIVYPNFTEAKRPFSCIYDDHYSIRSFEPICVLKRYKAKSGKAATPKQIFVDPELLNIINHPKLREDLDQVVENFKETIYRQIRLRLTPDVLMDLEVTHKKEKQLLSRIAEIIPKTADTIVVELGSNLDWLDSVKNVIKESGLPVRDQIDGSAIFITQPKITKEMREQMVKKGKQLSMKAKREMDLVYQLYDKKLKPKTLPKSVSDDDMRNARELLKQDVKYFHQKLDEVWEFKEKEILN